MHFVCFEATHLWTSYAHPFVLAVQSAGAIDEMALFGHDADVDELATDAFVARFITDERAPARTALGQDGQAVY